MLLQPCTWCGKPAPVRWCDVAEWPYARHDDCLGRGYRHDQHDDHLMTEAEYALWRMSNPG